VIIMADATSNFFEIQRRVILFKSTTTLPDNSQLGYNGDPNSASGSGTAGEQLLYNSPTGTRYQEDNGTQWYKKTLPNYWVRFGSGEKGDTGVGGPKGDTGVKGDTGMPGSAVYKGDTGERGFRGDTGIAGDKGDTGEQGDTGIRGPVGGYTMEYLFDNSKTTTPASGYLSLNDDAFSGTTTIYVSKLDRYGANVTNVLLQIINNDYMKIFRTDGTIAYGNFTNFGLTDYTNHVAFTVTHTSSSGIPDNGAPIGFSFTTIGFQGDTGTQGDTGVKGDTGFNGDTCIVGPQGDTGIPGSAVDKGDTGTQGDTGPQGPQGDTGAPGTSVAKGDTGEQGDTGVTGNKGDTGSQGEQGDTGIPGSAVEKGDTGIQGDTGVTGDTGIPGSAVAKGDTGETGPAGASKVILSNQTLSVANWYSSGSVYKYDFYNANLLNNTSVQITPSVLTENYAQEAEVYSFVEVDYINNIAIITAKRVPMGNIVVDVVIVT
jgi:hypothetical protein